MLLKQNDSASLFKTVSVWAAVWTHDKVAWIQRAFVHWIPVIPRRVKFLTHGFAPKTLTRELESFLFTLTCAPLKLRYRRALLFLTTLCAGFLYLRSENVFATISP